MQALDRCFADPLWGGYRQIQEAGRHVRKGERGVPILYVEERQQRTARDEHGTPGLDEKGCKKFERVERDRPLVKPHHVFNIEQTEGLNRGSLAAAALEREGRERAEAVMLGSGVWIEPAVGGWAFYRSSEDRIVLLEQSQFASQSAYTHGAARAGACDLAFQPVEQVAPERPRQLRHGTAYVSSWIEALENAPRETRGAAVDAQRLSDWLLAHEHDRTVEGAQPRDGPSFGGTAQTPDRKISQYRGDGEPVIPAAEDGITGKADESQVHVVAQRLVVGEAQRGASVPGDGDREEFVAVSGHGAKAMTGTPLDSPHGRRPRSVTLSGQRDSIECQRRNLTRLLLTGDVPSAFGIAE